MITGGQQRQPSSMARIGAGAGAQACCGGWGDGWQGHGCPRRPPTSIVASHVPMVGYHVRMNACLRIAAKASTHPCQPSGEITPVLQIELPLYSDGPCSLLAHSCGDPCPRSRRQWASLAPCTLLQPSCSAPAPAGGELFTRQQGQPEHWQPVVLDRYAAHQQHNPLRMV